MEHRSPRDLCHLYLYISLCISMNIYIVINLYNDVINTIYSAFRDKPPVAQALGKIAALVWKKE